MWLLRYGDGGYGQTSMYGGYDSYPMRGAPHWSTGSQPGQVPGLDLGAQGVV